MAHVATIDEVMELAGADTPVRPASEVKSAWGRIVREVARHGEVIVTNHNRPQAVVVDVSTYADLVRRANANDPLTALREEFDRRLAVLAQPGAGAKLRTVAARGIVPPKARRSPKPGR